MADNSDDTMSESELRELRRRIGAPDDWFPGQQIRFQQAQQQQEQQQDITDEWEAQKRNRPKHAERRDTGDGAELTRPSAPC